MDNMKSRLQEQFDRSVNVEKKKDIENGEEYLVNTAQRNPSETIRQRFERELDQIDGNIIYTRGRKYQIDIWRSGSTGEPLSEIGGYAIQVKSS
ncbi:hypothetical protein [Halovenus halobia]|uniref:hypothetical protein n=1 Tax=Halovenus halobia TaxID=3396622 RepID=UPI003F562C6E